MGFGLLFIGYFLHYLLGLNQLITFTTLIGCVLMYVGLSSLSLYCHTFNFARYTTFALALTAFYRTAEGITELFPVTISFVNDAIGYYVSLLELMVTVVFHVFLAIAIKEICLRTGVQKTAVRAMTNLVAVVLYELLWFSYSTAQQRSSMMPASVEQRSFSGMLYGFTMLMKLIWIFSNLTLIGSCYRRICPAGQEAADAKRAKKPSRFAFVNRVRERYQASEEKAIREDRAYRQQRYDEQARAVAQKNRNQHKKTRAQTRDEIRAAREASQNRDRSGR
jgi:uncharacterized membrane protein